MPSPASIVRSRRFRLVAGVCVVALIAAADRALSNEVPLALLYLLPVAGMSTVLRRWQILLLGVFCTCIAELADAFRWTVTGGIARDTLYFFAYTAAGLYVAEVVSRRRAETTHVAALEAEMAGRREVEEQLQLVVANSSIAILTADEAGRIRSANTAAETLFAGESGAVELLEGASLSRFLPSLAAVRMREQGWQRLRTMMQCQGLRAGREPFLADVWFSTYMTSGGGRLTAMIIDATVETRDREEANLEQVLVGSRLAIGAVSHEIRNICAAISVVQQNLAGGFGGVAGAAVGAAVGLAPPYAEDLDALRQLVAALERIASVELSLVKRQASRVSLERFLRELAIMIQPSLREAGIALEWRADAGLPDVLADSHSLLQVFLNLVRNAESALATTTNARLCLQAVRTGARVQIRLSDNGPGVRHPEKLFRPFRVGAAGSGGSGPGRAGSDGGSGLGLYLSRAMMLSFHGDLRFEPGLEGATFLVEMVAAEAVGADAA